MRTRYVFFLVVGAVVILPVLLWGHRDIPLDVLMGRYANGDSRFVAIEGMSVHYRVEGNASDTVPLLLLHGTGSSLHTWDGWVQVMQASRRIIRLDLPAFGLTGPAPSRDYTPEAYRRVVVALLDSLKVPLLDIAGNSLGGHIAWYTALRHPDRVRRLVLIDAVGYPLTKSDRPIGFVLAGIPVLRNVLTYITPRSVVEQSVLDVYADDSRLTEELVDRYFDLTLRPGNRQAFIDRSRPFDVDDAYTQIPTITHPTLILWGAEDFFVPISMARNFERDLPNDSLVIVPDAGHVPMEELPAETVRIVMEFLNRP